MSRKPRLREIYDLHRFVALFINCFPNLISMFPFVETLLRNVTSIKDIIAVKLNYVVDPELREG